MSSERLLPTTTAIAATPKLQSLITASVDNLARSDASARPPSTAPTPKAPSSNPKIRESPCKMSRAISGSRAAIAVPAKAAENVRSEEHTSELQSLMRISYAVFCLKKTNKQSELNRHQPSYNNQQQHIIVVTSYD